MKKKSLLLLVILSITTLSSCLKIKNEYAPVGEVNFKMIESLAPGARYLICEFSTEEQFGCLNYLIRYDYTSNMGNFEIHLKDVEKSDFCLTAPGPAKAELNLGTYQNGDYVVKIKVGDIENQGMLKVSAQHYVLDVSTPQNLTIVTDTLLRMPEHTIWGYASYQDDQFETPAIAFTDSLEQRGAQPANLPAGDFGYFTIGQNSQIVSIINAPEEKAIYFIYRFVDGDNAIMDLVSDFFVTYSNDIIIIVYTSEGQTFSSLS